MNAKQKYKLAYRHTRQWRFIAQEDAQSTYPYWFDCPDRHNCGDMCYCLEAEIRGSEISRKAIAERKVIESLEIPDSFFKAAKTSHAARFHNAPRMSVLCKLANMGASTYIRAYKHFNGQWYWDMAGWVDPVKREPQLSEDKVRLKARLLEVLSDRKLYLHLMCGHLW